MQPDRWEPAGNGARGSALIVAAGTARSGCTTVAALLALGAAAAGRRTLVVDGGGSGGVLRQLLRARPLGGRGYGDGSTLHALLHAVDHRLSLLPLAAEPLVGLLPRSLPELYAEYDTVVVDAGSRLGVVQALADSGARLLVVTSTERASLTAAYALIKAMAYSHSQLPVEVVVVRAEEETGRRIFEELRTAAGRFLHSALTLAGVVPEDASLPIAVSAGMMLQDAAEGSPAALAIQEVAHRTLVTSRADSLPRALQRRL